MTPTPQEEYLTRLTRRELFQRAGVGIGGMAEQAVAEVALTEKIPDSMPFDTGAGFGMIYHTSYHALKQRADLQPEETLLVLGAAGGVGPSPSTPWVQHPNVRNPEGEVVVDALLYISRPVFFGEDFDANQRRLVQDEIFRPRAGHDADVRNAESSR